MMKKFKNGKYIVLPFILLLAFSLTACSTDDKKAVAVVGDTEITEEEFHELLVERYGEETLGALISEKVIEAEIKKADVKIESEEIDKEFEAMAEQYGGKEGLDAAMASSNISEKEVKEEIERTLALKTLLKSDLKVTDEEIAKYYEENKENFGQKEQVDASHILVETEDKAKEVRKKLVDGADRIEIAKEYSIDPGSKDNGGDLGFFERGKMVPEFEEAAFSMKVGEISEPVKTENGYHIIIVNDKKEAKTTSLEENKDDIRAILEDAKMPEAFKAWYSEKVTEYDITNNLEKEEEKK